MPISRRAPVAAPPPAPRQLEHFCHLREIGQHEDRTGRSMGRPVDPRALAQVEAAFAGSAENEFEIRFRRKDGSMFWAALFINPILDKTGNVVQHFASFVDLSKHKQEEDRLRFLLAELNHRTQNTLSTVQAIAVQTLLGAANKEVVD